MDKDKQEYIVKLEKAISKKYGQEAINNPRRFWDEDKEKEYITQSQDAQKKFAKLAETKDKVEQDGFLINKKLLNKDTNRVCSVCEKYSFDVGDNLYINKFDCCRKCYVQWVEDRERRWLTGWRPQKEKENNG